MGAHCAGLERWCQAVIPADGMPASVAPTELPPGTACPIVAAHDLRLCKSPTRSEIPICDHVHRIAVKSLAMGVGTSQSGNRCHWQAGYLRRPHSGRIFRGKSMFSPAVAKPLGYFLSIGFLIGAARAAGPPADPAREVLPPGDGWASQPSTALPLGTTGGSNASVSRTVTVTNRNELVAALAWPDPTPKLIYVRGIVDANVDEAS